MHHKCDSSSSSSLSCELIIKRAKNIHTNKSTRKLFVRCYLSAGNKNTVRLETQKLISSKYDDVITWNQTFSLDCSGTQDSIKLLKQGTVIFELRSRSTTPLFGKSNGSKLIGKAEIPWENVFESKDMKIERWVSMISPDGNLKPPSLQVDMKIIQEYYSSRKINGRKDWEEECGCMDGGGKNCCVEYEYFAIAAALEEAM